MTARSLKAEQPHPARPADVVDARAATFAGPDTGPPMSALSGDRVSFVPSAIGHLQRHAGNSAVVDLLGRTRELVPASPASDVQRHAQGAGPSFDAASAETAVNDPGTPVSAPAASGGGGRRPARLPNKAMDVATAEAALNAAFGTVHTMTRPPIKIVSKRELLRAYDKYCIDNSVPYTDDRTGTTRPWRRGDADPSIEGFAMPDGSAIYVQKDTVLPTATAHEMLHANTAADFRATVGEAINEGTTEMFAIKAVAAAGLPTVGRTGAKAYPDQVAAVTKLVSVVGEGALVGAYFGGADSLVKAYEALMPHTFAALKGTGTLDTAHMAALLVPRTAAEKTTLVNDRLSASMTAADIAEIRAICASDAADVGAIASGTGANLEAAIRAKVTEQTSASLAIAADLAGLPIADVAALRTSIGPDITLLVMAKLVGAPEAADIADATALADLPFADRDALAISVSTIVGIHLATGFGNLDTVATLGNLPFADKTSLTSTFSPVIVAKANGLLDGWVTDADLDQIETLYGLPMTDRAVFAATLAPRASSLFSWDQRMRLRNMLASP